MECMYLELIRISSISKKKKSKETKKKEQERISDCLCQKIICLPPNPFVKQYKFLLPWLRLPQTQFIQKMCHRDPSVTSFDEHMSYYCKVAEEMRAEPATVDVRFMRINMTQLCSAIIKHAEEWVQILGSTLRERAKTEMDIIDATINVSLVTQSSSCCSPPHRPTPSSAPVVVGGAGVRASSLLQSMLMRLLELV